jgi:hypothetical protein
MLRATSNTPTPFRNAFNGAVERIFFAKAFLLDSGLLQRCVELINECSKGPSRRLQLACYDLHGLVPRLIARSWTQRLFFGDYRPGDFIKLEHFPSDRFVADATACDFFCFLCGGRHMTQNGLNAQRSHGTLCSC